MSILKAWAPSPAAGSRRRPAERADQPAPRALDRRSPGRRAGFVVLACIAILVGLEIRTSWLQSRIFTAVARRMTYGFEPVAGSAPRYPGLGPYDVRLGYSRLPDFLARLEPDYEISRQARLSPAHRRLVDLGLFPIYDEKLQAGLRVRDRRGVALHAVDYPQRVFEDFASVPPLVVRTLLFIENRELLDETHPRRNPAVEWDRLARALLEKGVEPIRGGRVAGASTLATQLEKLRHSPGGRTASAREKLRQMLSASLRAYRRGEETTAARREIFLQYLNSLPLAAAPGFGEVNGLADGLWAWYGADAAEVSRLLATPSAGAGDPEIDATARAFRQTLSLCLAQQRPSLYLLRNHRALDALVDTYLGLLEAEGVISSTLAARTRTLRVDLRERAPDARAMRLAQKPVQALRTRLASTLGIRDLYDLDRLDLEVRSTLDAEVQQAVLDALRALGDARAAHAAGLDGPRLLARGDPARVVYSFTLYERVDQANVLRVQADTYDRPLNVNEGVKLELGSTAKLRTLVTYLEIVAALHEQYAALSRAELARIPVASSDRLTRWALAFLAATPDRSLTAMLEAAMNRRYSASPAEGFFTGGGRHVFRNFDPAEDRRVPTVREAFRDSINLAFIRLMRDVVGYYMLRVPGSSAQILEDASDPRRHEYLARFADREGREFLRRFYRKHHGQSPDEALHAVIAEARPTPRRLAALVRSVRPELEFDGFAALLRERLRGSTLSPRTLRELYEASDPARFGLADRGFLAHVHPLQLWLLEYLGRHPDASFEQVIEASAGQRQEVYRWLFRTRWKDAQDIRIRTLLEVEAFLEIHRAWKRLGYPFETLVPSYATAIGSSADRPAALAELVGIVVSGGLRYPTLRVEELDFAGGTPYETRLVRAARPAERLLPAAVAEQLRRELLGVVESGTGRRLRDAATLSDGRRLPLGGKTGTGDNRREVYGARGQLIESRALNRTATFVFFVGDRFFGTLTSYVPGPQADGYGFTSSLSLEVLRHLFPHLRPLLEAPPADAATRAAAAPAGPAGS